MPSDTEEMTEDTGSRVLVAYFSLAGEQYEVGEIAKGNTQIIAEMIAEETGADLYSIDPVKEYPDDYDGKLTEATKERENDERPEINGRIENFDEYDIIFIGYPIWWGGMPMIMYTFLRLCSNIVFYFLFTVCRYAVITGQVHNQFLCFEEINGHLLTTECYTM